MKIIGTSGERISIFTSNGQLYAQMNLNYCNKSLRVRNLVIEVSANTLFIDFHDEEPFTCKIASIRA